MTAAEKIRTAIRDSREGLHLAAISDATGISKDRVRYALSNRMGDAYIDHWDMVDTPAGPRLAPVWCVVEVPPHMPRPGALDERIQPKVYAMLMGMGRATIRDIADTIGANRRAVSQALRRLHAKGLVKRVGTVMSVADGSRPATIWGQVPIKDAK